MWSILGYGNGECFMEKQSNLTEVSPIDNLSVLAVKGLMASIEAGYLTEEKARNIFANYFPEDDFDKSIACQIPGAEL